LIEIDYFVILFSPLIIENMLNFKKYNVKVFNITNNSMDLILTINSFEYIIFKSIYFKFFTVQIN